MVLLEERVLNVNMWAYTMHFCVPVNNSMTLLTNNFHATIEQHEQLGKSRLTHDVIGWKKIFKNSY